MGLFITRNVLTSGLEAQMARPMPGQQPAAPLPVTQSNETYYSWFSRRVSEITDSVTSPIIDRIAAEIVENDEPEAPAETWTAYGSRVVASMAAAAQEDPSAEGDFEYAGRKAAELGSYAYGAVAGAVNAVSEGAMQMAVNQYVENDEPQASAPSWMFSKGVSLYLNSFDIEGKRDELRLWLGTSQIEQVTQGLASQLHPLISSFGLNTEQSQQVVIIMMHSLAKKSLKDGQANLGDMILTLTTIIKKHVPVIKEKAGSIAARHDLDNQANEILSPMVRDLLDVLLPPKEELLPFKNGLNRVYRYLFSGTKAGQNGSDDLIDLITNAIATKGTLNFTLRSIEAFENVANKAKLSPAIVEKMDAAVAPAVVYVQKRLAVHHKTVSDELFAQFGFSGTHMKDWWESQVKDLIDRKDGAGNELLTYATHVAMQTFTNVFVSMGDEQQVRDKVVELVIDVVKFGAANEEQLWNLDPKADNKALFAPLADLLIEKLHLDKPETLPFAPALRPLIVKLINEQLAQILSISYASGMANDVKQLGVTPFDKSDINVSVNKFARASGNFAGHFLFKAFLPTEEGTRTISESIAKTVVEHPEYADFAPHSQKFWSESLTKITNSDVAPVLQRWTAVYTKHSTESIMQTILERVIAAESTPGFREKFKESAVQIVSAYLSERNAGPVALQVERMELLKQLSHLIKDVIKLEPEMLPVPLQFQESLWDSWLPQALDQCLVKFCEPKFLKQKLAAVIKGISVSADVEFEQVLFDNPANPDLDKACAQLLKDAALFIEIPFAKRAAEMGIRDKGSYNFVVSMLYGILGKQFTQTLNNQELSVILTTALESGVEALSTAEPTPAQKAQALANENLDVVDEIMKKVDEALKAKVESFESNIRTTISDWFDSWIKGLGGPVNKMMKIFRVLLNILLTPVYIVLTIAKHIAYWFIKRKLRFSIEKMEKTFDATLAERMVRALGVNLDGVGAARLA